MSKWTLNAVWLLLLALTASSLLIAESQLTLGGLSWVLLLGACKACLITGFFMELKQGFGWLWTMFSAAFVLLVLLLSWLLP